jgi:hypothetical protein
LKFSGQLVEIILIKDIQFGLTIGLKFADTINMKRTILALFISLPMLLGAQAVSSSETDVDPVEIALSRVWKILNDSSIYPFWMAVVPRGEWDFDETITTDQWMAALEGQNENYILWPGDAQAGDWENGNVIIGGYWTPELSAIKSGFLVQEDFTEEWIELG